MNDGEAMSGETDDGALTRTVEITNRRGLHARASAKFVTMASGLTADVRVAKDGGPAVVGTSIMGLMMLGAAIGDSITISTSGTDAEAALEQLCTLVEGKFGED
jgi:phosphocarrier protein HPr